MISISSLHRKRSVGLLVDCIFLGATPVVAQDGDQLQQQLEQLKQEYETTTQALQLRMAALEQQIQSHKEASEKVKEATVSAADLAAERAAKAVLGDNSDQVGASFHRLMWPLSIFFRTTLTRNLRNWHVGRSTT